ncbi:MAG: phage replisome organizer N-terminal domain-containing protein [Clostridiales bacterium]|nr:phage replisome organizer N-terminal domain-containing protein [Clostridiales bacterium]
MADGKYYWLKLKRDFFKRHDIRIIESMPNGKDYILFYLKLLCESVDHEGNLRFSEQIPYNEDMLATITNTNVDVVRSAIKVFTELQMMEILDDGTVFMTEVQKMIGSFADNDNANRQRRFRERKKELALQERYASVTKNNESKSIEIEKEKDIENRGKAKRFTPPSLEDVRSYCQERKNNVDAERFVSYYESVGWKVGKNPMKDWKACVRTWEQRDKQTAQEKKKDDIITHDYSEDFWEERRRKAVWGE